MTIRPMGGRLPKTTLSQNELQKAKLITACLAIASLKEDRPTGYTEYMIRLG